jgi:hypothetical protein
MLAIDQGVRTKRLCLHRYDKRYIAAFNYLFCKIF